MLHSTTRIRTRCQTKKARQTLSIGKLAVEHLRHQQYGAQPADTLKRGDAVNLFDVGNAESTVLQTVFEIAVEIANMGVDQFQAFELPR